MDLIKNFIEKPEYTLENIVRRNRKDPRHFLKPSDEEIRSLRVGDSVRLIFLLSEPQKNGCRAERMWVKIKSINDGEFTGKLANKPYYIKSLRLGSKIKFSAKNIATVVVPSGPSFDTSKYALITKRALKHKQINWLIKTDDLADEYDSGWQFFYGDEDDEYLSNPRNGTLISLENAISFEPLIEKALERYGDVYGYSEFDKNFIEIEDWESAEE